MRLLYLTAGAAEMYCGSCLRDNALAAALLARGHDVVLTPIYTPTTTDEPNVSASRVFFGGVSVFLEQHVPLFRYTPAFLDQVWDSTRRAAAGVEAADQGRPDGARQDDGVDAARASRDSRGRRSARC